MEQVTHRNDVIGPSFNAVQVQEIQVSEIDLGKPPPGATEELVGEVEPGDGMAAIVAGVVVLLVPRVLSYVVGIDLVVIGLLEAGVVRA